MRFLTRIVAFGEEQALATSLDVALRAATAACAKQARDVRVLDVSVPLVIADYFVICSASNERLVHGICDTIEDACREQGARVRHREGGPDGNWVLLDFSDVVVHVFREEERHYYDLERLWRDAPVVAHSEGTGDLVVAGLIPA